jgi:hypothetical protein
MSKLKWIRREEQMTVPRKMHQMKAKSDSSSPHRKDVANR